MNDKHKRTPTSTVPAPNVAELVAERNWAALAGLALMAVGALHALQRLVGWRVDWWALLLVGVGSWLAYTAWRPRPDAPHGGAAARTRALVGVALAVGGAMQLLTLNWWGVLVFGSGAWLGYDTQRRAQALGGVWTRDLRNRMFVAALLAFFGLSAIFPLGGLWWLVLVVGGVLLYRRARA